MKATLRNGKGSAMHNDRTYQNATEQDKKEIIGIKKLYDECTTIHENELKAYNLLYGDWLKNQNEKYTKARHKEKVKTMEQILGGTNLQKTKSRYEPTETILQIGKDGEEIPNKLFFKCINDYIKQLKQKYGSNMEILDITVHKEESSVLHAHLRRTWYEVDENGIKRPNKKGALQQLGFEIGKNTRFDNATIRQTAEERELWYEVLELNGLRIDKVADLDNAEHQAPKEYKRQADARKKYIQKLDNIIEKATNEFNSLQDELDIIRNYFNKHSDCMLSIKETEMQKELQLMDEQLDLLI